MSGCDRVVVVRTRSQDTKTVVTWLAFTLDGLTGFQVTLAQGGETANFEAEAGATDVTATFAAKPDCTATVTPVTAAGPATAQASVATPVPFPPAPIDPAAGRPQFLRACATGTQVTVNFLPATNPYLLGYYLTITENNVSLTNFDVDQADATAWTVDYDTSPTGAYTVTLTPYDQFGIDLNAVSYSEPIPYPGQSPARSPDRSR